METISKFLAMGGYAAFVWPAIAAAVAVLGGLAWRSWTARRAARRALDALPTRRLG